jgi:hypothetical protein
VSRRQKQQSAVATFGREDLKNAGVRGVPLGPVALVEDEECDVPEAEEAVPEVVEQDLRRHDEDLGSLDGGAPGVGAPEVDPHLAVELGDAEVGVRVDDARLLADEDDCGDEEDGEGARLPADAVRVGAQQQHRDERLPGARLQERNRVPAHRPLQRLQLVPSSQRLRVGRRRVFICCGGFGGGDGGRRGGHGDEGVWDGLGTVVLYL